MLGTRGVPSLDDALRELQLEPVHRPVRALFAGGLGSRIVAGTATKADVLALTDRYETVLESVAVATGLPDRAVENVAALAVARVGRVFRAGADLPEVRADRAALLAWLLLEPTGRLAPASDMPATSRAWYEELLLAPVVAAGLREAGLDEAAAWSTADLLRVLLDLPRPGRLGGPAATADARLLEAWLGRDDLRAAIGVNTWEGTEWLDGERFRRMLEWAARLDAIELAARASPGSLPAPPATRAGNPLERLTAAAESAGYRVDWLREALAPPAHSGSAARTTAKPKPVRQTAAKNKRPPKPRGSGTSG
jgi:hypothetical protein